MPQSGRPPLHLLFDLRLGAPLRPKVRVAVVVADRETARDAVIQLAKAAIGVGNAVGVEDAPCLGLIGSAVSLEEPRACGGMVARLRPR